MENDFIYLYPYSRNESKRLNQLNLWRDSHKENIRCKKSIEDAIRRDFDGTHLKDGCAESVIMAYGYKRVSWVLANTVKQQDWNKDFSEDNKEWAKHTYIPPDKDGVYNQNYNLDFVVDSQPAVLDGFINQFRRAYQALGLFDFTHCELDSKYLNYEGKVLVLSQDILSESHWNPKNQLWLATGGFGCNPNSSGRAVLATCLGDDEKTRWNRSDFTGVLKEVLLPDWASEKLAELQKQQTMDSEAAGMGGLEMK
ncbi:MAG TPA: DUF3849 domain-containing protein [Bacillota bacterium]|nr:DUF3849 domain-containing protein [Bacillota bacterium]